MLSIKQTAEACNVSYGLIYDAVHDGRIVVVQFGRVYRIPLEEVERGKAEGIPPIGREIKFRIPKSSARRSKEGRRPWLK